jgi:hypothetical protein
VGLLAAAGWLGGARSHWRCTSAAASVGEQRAEPESAIGKLEKARLRQSGGHPPAKVPHPFPSAVSGGVQRPSLEAAQEWLA